MADAASREKKLAAARKKLQRFQNQKSPATPKGETIKTKRPSSIKEMNVEVAPKGRNPSPSIDDMSTWPNYSLEMNNSYGDLDYSLDSPSVQKDLMDSPSSPKSFSAKKDFSTARLELNYSPAAYMGNEVVYEMNGYVETNGTNGDSSTKSPVKSDGDWSVGVSKPEDNIGDYHSNQSHGHQPVSPSSISNEYVPNAHHQENISTLQNPVEANSDLNAQQAVLTTVASTTNSADLFGINYDNKVDSSANEMPSEPLSPPTSVQAANHSEPDTFPHSDVTTTATTEGLHQLSRKMNGLLSSVSEGYFNGDSATPSGDLQELEYRNRELAVALEKYTQANQQLQLSCQEMKMYNIQLHDQLTNERAQFDERLRKEISAIKEQLQVHIQTIGILVAEKSELQTSLSTAQKLAEARQKEVDELTGRLKASRTRVTDLERTLSTSSSSSEQFQKSSKELSKEVDRLKLELYKVNKSLDENKQLNSELQEKLQAKVVACDTFEHSVNELRHGMEMKDVLIQQLSNQPNDVHAQALDILQQERMELINRIEQYNEAFHQLTSERDQITEQYQNYTQQLTGKIGQLESQISRLSEERDELSTSLCEMESANRSLREQALSTTPSINVPELETKIDELQLKINSLTEEKESLNKSRDQLVVDNSQLSRMLEERDHQISDLEVSIDRMKDDVVDKSDLLESIQNDKVSLSRAIAQNRDLKNQLEELQSGFVDMSNKNMDMLSQLQSEQHTSRELNIKIQRLEDELREVRQQLQIKEFDLEKLRAQEVQQAPVTVDSDETLAITCQHLQQERDRLMQELTTRTEENSVLTRRVDFLVSEMPMPSDGTEVTQQQYDQLKNAMLLLEDKYATVMSEKAELVDNNERLEHLVVQLQGETDTIGEYITIYHHQRALLAERELQKEQHIKQLAADRQDLQGKLSQLQVLMMQLIQEQNERQSIDGTVLERRLQRAKGQGHHHHHNREDWPDYNTSDTDSDTDQSVVETITVSAADSSVCSDTASAATLAADALNEMDLNTTPESVQNPMAQDATAAKIMHLITDIGKTNLNRADILDNGFSPCKCCTGRLEVV